MISARWILPVSADPINGGWVRLCGNQVVEVGKGSPDQPAQNLEDVAILPGLVNAHTHLEFSDLRQPIGQPGIELPEWIGQVVRARTETDDGRKQRAVEAGLQESRDAGVALVGEIATPPWHYDDISSPQLVTFAEVLGLNPARGNERLAAAIAHNRDQGNAGWSPHAPYSTSIELIQRCVQLAKDDGRPVAMHVAESPAERELLQSGTGPFAEALRKMGVWNDERFPWPEEPFLHLIDLLAKAPRSLIVHGNDLREHEISAIATHDHMSVVYCPRTHAFFGHARHPVGDLMKAGVRVALGTDSRASNPDLSLWREVQFLLNHRPDLHPNSVIQMATLNGADALGHSGFGRIEPQSRGELGYVKTTATNTEELYQDLAENEFHPISDRH